MQNIRKTIFVEDTIFSDCFGEPCKTVNRVAALAVSRNPYANRFAEDLSVLFNIGATVGADLARQAIARLNAPAVSYGKGAIVGAGGNIEHGGAVIHPKIGAPMRLVVGGGEAVIPSNVKIGGPGSVLDFPLGHKDNPWSFDHFDTMTLMISDAPRADEIVMILAYATAGRPLPRCGSGPVG